MKFPVYCLWSLCLSGTFLELCDMDLMCDSGIEVYVKNNWCHKFKVLPLIRPLHFIGKNAEYG
jgi:hypothetical protein